jgi:MtN3 and saliva related transmembrane protein
MKNDALIATVGILAGLCTSVSFVPQVVKIWKQGGRDLSCGMLALYLAGVLLWLWYGIMENALAIILANAATGTLVLVATVLKAWTDRRSRSTENVLGQASERA